MGILANKRGAALVEFAIVVILLLVLLFAVIDFGLAIRAHLALSQIAREAARTAAIGGDAQTTVDTWSVKLGLESSKIDVSTETLGTAPDIRVAVTLTYPYHWMAGGLLGLSDTNLSASMVMRKE